ncbi:MAG: lipid-A-disaccharide synthase [Parachlamydiaceae bacterium]
MTVNPKHIFVFAGEPSGDLLGEGLVCALKKQQPDLRIDGVAGPRMRAAHISGPLVMEDFAVMGFSDVLRSLPRLYWQFLTVRRTILNSTPDAVVLIDYPGFNLRMAKSLRAKNYQGKIIQYVSPSVWAWGPERAVEMGKSYDLLMTIYPFEKAYFSKTPLKVCYVGSPVKEKIAVYSYQDKWKSALSIPESPHLIALFPGSRAGEIARNLPLMLEAASLLKLKHPEAVFGISCATDSTRKKIQDIINRFQVLKQAIFLVPGIYTYELMRDSRCALAKSGTVTLELALHCCPTVVIYQLTMLNRWYAKYIMKTNLPHYCIVNIFLGKEVFPELIKQGLTIGNIYKHLENLYFNHSRREKCIQECQDLCREIGTGNASTSAAEAVLTQVMQ